MDTYDVLHQSFDINTHKEHFHNYCEVIIHPEGLIEYAVPSHEKKLVSIYAQKHSMTEDEVYKKFWSNPDWIDIIMDDIKCMYVWYDHLYNATNLTEAQHKSLSMLIEHGCISDACISDIQEYTPFNSAWEKRQDNVRRWKEAEKK